MTNHVDNFLRAVVRAACAAACLAVVAANAGADWPTHRGNAARTGNVDRQPGPRSPAVLWAYRASEQFIASPVAAGDALYVSGLGSLNTARLHALSLDPAATQRVLWSKGPPTLKQPVVSPPAIAGGKLVFGDGMHQTAGAALRCLAADSGQPLWQLDVPGQLVHIESAATIAGERVYIGGGNAGVLCVDLSRVTLGGQELPLAATQAIIAQRWQELLAKYEADKQADPDFAAPPSDDSLPRPRPVVHWQQGKDAWHVDAPVAVADDRVLAASAFLEHEQSGERALFCLRADTGETLWKRPLPLNPWGGAAVAGDTAYLGCSNIRFDPQQLGEAKGEVVALRLADGEFRWRRRVAGAIVSAVAVADNLVVAAATDGKVRAFDAATGNVKWTYDGGAAFFAGPAVAADGVYAADLEGVVHAINLSDGAERWRLAVASDPAVGVGGMFYGSPIVQGGRVYVALYGPPGGGSQRAVVCIGEQSP